MGSSPRFEVGGADDPRPLFGFIGDELSEGGRRAGKRRGAEVGQSCLDLGSASPALMTALSFGMMSSGVFLLASMPFQPLAS